MVKTLASRPKRPKRDDICPSIRRSCVLLGVNRSTVYKPRVPVSDENSVLLERIASINFAHQYYGVRRITHVLRTEGFVVNEKRIRRLMRSSGVHVMYPKRRTTTPNKAHAKHPYKLRGLRINEPGQVWCSDITYLRIGSGNCYLCCVMDWASRKVLSWRLSNSMTVDLCLLALDDALLEHPHPSVFNTDQGSQYTSSVFADRLSSAGIGISHNGVGRCKDNAVIERFWGSLKQECIYGKDIHTLAEARTAVGRWITYYNQHRPHQGLPECSSPDRVYHNPSCLLRVAYATRSKQLGL